VLAAKRYVMTRAIGTKSKYISGSILKLNSVTVYVRIAPKSFIRTLMELISFWITGSSVTVQPLRLKGTKKGYES